MASTIKKLKDSATSSSSKSNTPPGHKEIINNLDKLSLEGKEKCRTGSQAKVAPKLEPRSSRSDSVAKSKGERPTCSSNNRMSKIISLPQMPKKYGLKDITLDRTLGTGTFGRVHLIRIKDSKEYCALKVLKKSEIIRMRQLEHTLNERQILSRLQHPFLVSLIGTFQDPENVYFIMEYIQGGELFSYLRKYVVLIIFFIYSVFLMMLLNFMQPKYALPSNIFIATILSTEILNQR